MASPPKNPRPTRAASRATGAPGKLFSVAPPQKPPAELYALDVGFTERELMFLNLYAVHSYPIPRAASLAGLTRAAAEVLLAHPEARKIIQSERSRVAEKVRITKEDVIEGLKEAIELGREVGRPEAMVAGWREIGRIIGCYEPVQVNHVHHKGGPISQKQIASMTDEQLLEMAADAATVVEGSAVEVRPAPEDDNDS